jgi:hypothetical protein
MLPREGANTWLEMLIIDGRLEPKDVPRKVRELLRATRDPVPAAAVLKAGKVLAAAVGKSLPARLRTASEAGKTREATLRKLEAWVHTERQLLEPLQLLPRPRRTPATDALRGAPLAPPLPNPPRARGSAGAPARRGDSPGPPRYQRTLGG